MTTLSYKVMQIGHFARYEIYSDSELIESSHLVQLRKPGTKSGVPLKTLKASAEQRILEMTLYDDYYVPLAEVIFVDGEFVKLGKKPSKAQREKWSADSDTEKYEPDIDLDDPEAVAKHAREMSS